MDIYTAAVLRGILAHAPCTKLCLKQHTALSMSTVLRAVDNLSREGWITISTYTVPQGGKPHAKIEIGARPVYGAAKTDEGWQICILPLGGCPRFTLQRELPHATPLTVATKETAELAACATEGSTHPFDAPKNGGNADIGAPLLLSRGQVIARFLAHTDGGVYIDADLRLHRAGYRPTALGTLPSPMLTHRRLDYAEALRQGTHQQKNRLTAELATFVRQISGVEKVCFEGQQTLPSDAEMAARCSLYSLLWPTCDKGFPH